MQKSLMNSPFFVRLKKVKHARNNIQEMMGLTSNDRILYIKYYGYENLLLTFTAKKESKRPETARCRKKREQ